MNQVKYVPFVTSKEGVFPLTIKRFDKVLMPDTLTIRILHMSNFSKKRDTRRNVRNTTPFGKLIIGLGFHRTVTKQYDLARRVRLWLHRQRNGCGYVSCQVLQSDTYFYQYKYPIRTEAILIEYNSFYRPWLGTIGPVRLRHMWPPTGSTFNRLMDNSRRQYSYTGSRALQLCGIIQAGLTG